MSFTRRALVTAAAAAPVLAGAAKAATTAPALPAKSAFAKMPYAYLDSGSTHPMPLGARTALEEYLRYKTRDGTTPGYDMDKKEAAVMARFAALVGAEPSELCFIQSTTMGENLVLKAMGYPQTGGRIVTDAAHFFGSFYTYGELAKAGVDVVTLPFTKEGAIDYAAMAAAVNGQTKLVAISAISTANGFQHDLKKVCDIAHAHGAIVYVDMVHAAGSTPIDLRAAGVDFAASSSYKWLMGDFGLGFLYVRKEIQDRFPRPWWGYHQVGGRFITHVYPYDTPADHDADYGYDPGATGRFGMGTTSWTGAVQLDWSLSFIESLTVPAIQAYRQPLIDAVQSELRRRGYEPMTPLGTRTPLVAFALKDARKKLPPLLDRANVKITVSQHRFRASLAVFNDMNDVDKLLAALPANPPA
ncbi:aminotransferase class V-fold PLP-dependent enzyme [Phenylobacterium sp.]|jgi:selenocysteine lyase/cysteine desulfurase|uniref:aminotransferase class V-fold PLP-dependent enzyme n=1 Tax=Phenylobacterium sp. TaxID=1871053 RepID=UPI002E303014|nr:aminotransferase class V-fold PLP-dependent enzyme [Phenylobacterium sp.]HEX3366324.1 aminotransferase class V-fold PLP-dependent enzyme [Phenylobacterium sp.]